MTGPFTPAELETLRAAAGPSRAAHVVINRELAERVLAILEEDERAWEPTKALSDAIAHADREQSKLDAHVDAMERERLTGRMSGRPDRPCARTRPPEGFPGTMLCRTCGFPLEQHADA